MTIEALRSHLCVLVWLRSPKAEAQRRLQRGQGSPVIGAGAAAALCLRSLAAAK